jgi:hypothetical protein
MEPTFKTEKLPGYATTSHYPTSPWEAFEPDADWSESVLWVRLCFGAKCVQLKGTVSGSGESPAVIGQLKPEFRPARRKGFAVAGRRHGWPNLVIQEDGAVILFGPSLAQSFVLHVVYAVL